MYQCPSCGSLDADHFCPSGACRCCGSTDLEHDCPGFHHYSKTDSCIICGKRLEISARGFVVHKCDPKRENGVEAGRKGAAITSEVPNPTFNSRLADGFRLMFIHENE